MANPSWTYKDDPDLTDLIEIMSEDERKDWGRGVGSIKEREDFLAKIEEHWRRLQEAAKQKGFNSKEDLTGRALELIDGLKGDFRQLEANAKAREANHAKPQSEADKQPTRHPVLAVLFGVVGTLILNELHVPLKLTLPLWIALGLCIWQWPRIVKTRQRQVVFWTATVLYSLVIASYLVITPHKMETSSFEQGKSTIVPATSPTAVSKGEEQTVVNVDPEYIVGLYKKYNSVQADEAVKTYIGNPVRMSGAVSDVSRQKHLNASDTVSMTMSVNTKDGWFYVVVCDFDNQRWMDRALVFGKSEKVTIVGKLVRASDIGIILEKCEVVD